MATWKKIALATGDVNQYIKGDGSLGTYSAGGTSLNGTGYVKASGTTISYVNETYSLSSHNHNLTYQPLATQLTKLAALNIDDEGGLVRFNFATGSAGTFSLDTTSYITGLSWDGVTGKPTTFPPSDHTHSYQAADADLLAIAGLTGTSGFLKKTATDVWALDTSAYSLTSHNHDASYAAIGHNHLNVYAPVAHSHAIAATDSNGFMSAADKVKLDAISGTNTGDQNLSGYALTSHTHTSISFLNDAWHLSVDAKKRFYFGTNGRTYFGSPDGYVFRSANDAVDLATLTNAGSLTITGALAASNLSGTNTGDQNLSGYALVSHNHSGVYAPVTHSHTDAAADAAGFMSSANFNKLGAISGTNTGDQTNISGNAATATTAGNITAYTINQSVGTSNSPTFPQIYTGGWFRNNSNLTGLYSEANGNHWYSSSEFWIVGNNNAGSGGIQMRYSYQGAVKGYIGYWDANGFGLLTSGGNWSIRGNYGTSYTGGELYGNWRTSGTIAQHSTANGGITNLLSWSGTAGGFHDIYYDGGVQVHLSAGPASGESYINNGYLNLGTGLRAPIFYDSNDTNYYVDPASTSRMYKIDFGSPGYYIHAGDWGMRNTTPYGWIQFGPANSGHAHIYTSMSNFYFNAMIQVNGGSQMNTNDIRANIFYDQQDTGYYLDPNGTSNTSYWTGRAKAGMGLTGKYTTPRWDYTTDTNYWTGAMGWGTTDLNDVAAWGSGFFDTWSSPGNGPGTTSHYVGLQAFHYTAGGNSTYGFQMVSTTNANRYHLRNTWGGWTGWVEMITSGNIGSQTVSTANAVSFNGGLTTGSSPTFYHTYSSSGMRFGEIWGYGGVYRNSGSMLFGTESGGWTFQYQNSEKVWIATDGNIWMAWAGQYISTLLDQKQNASNAITTGNIGSYTSGNTNSISSAVGGSYTWTNTNYFRSNNNTAAGNSFPLQCYSDNSSGAVMSFHRGGYYAVNMGLDSDNVFRIGGWSASANRFQMDMSGNLTMAGDVTAYSDARIKTNIKTIENALEKTLKLRGVSYNRTDSNDIKTKIGVIAQEVIEVLPEVVNQDNDGMYNVSYGNIVGLLIEAIKELKVELNELKECRCK